MLQQKDKEPDTKLMGLHMYAFTGRYKPFLEAMKNEAINKIVEDIEIRIALLEKEFKEL